MADHGAHREYDSAVTSSARFRYFWQRPRTHRDAVADRRVSFLELFYDLVYVVLISRIALSLHVETTRGSVGNFVILFSLVWIGWYNGSLLHDAHGRGDTRNRLLTFLQMFALSAMAVFASDAATAGSAFAICYTAFLIILVWQWVVVARLERGDPVYGPIARRYAIAMVVMTVWIGASALATPAVRMWMWGGFVAVFVVGGLGSAFLLDRDAAHAAEAGRPLATESLLERFALFIIIVLGEVVASVITGLGDVTELSASIFFTGFAGLAVGVAFWWSYFDLVAMRAPIATTRARYIYNLAQLPLALAITGVGAATVGMIENGSQATTPDATAWLFGGFVALAMVTLALLMRLLADYERLKSAYQPTVVISLLIAVFALGLAALDPPPLVLATLTFVAMCIQWIYAVIKWLGTTDGEAAVAQAQLPGVLQDAADPEP